jgi:hypothetical protein
VRSIKYQRGQARQALQHRALGDGFEPEFVPTPGTGSVQSSMGV